MSVRSFLGTIGILLLFAVLTVSAIEGFAAKQGLGEEIINGTLNGSETAKGLGLYSWGMMITTGAWQNDWLPEKIHPKGEYLFIIEDMPHLDSTVFVLPILFVVFIFWLVKISHIEMTGWRAFWFWFIIFLIAVGIVIATYIAGYQALKRGGELLGIGAEKALEIRQDKVDILDNKGVVFLAVILFFTTLSVWLQWLGILKKE